MSHLQLVVAILTASLGRAMVRSNDSLERTDARIFGGRDTSVAEVPFICSIQQQSIAGPRHLCGGTVLNEVWLLTSGHCVYGQDIDDLSIVCGFGQRRAIAQIIHPPDFVHLRTGNDLALLALKRALLLTDYVQPIPVFAGDEPSSGWASIVGYGLRNGGVDKSGWNGKSLQIADVQILADSECEQQLGRLAAFLTDSNICTDRGPLGSSSTCIGDSGGPVMIATSLQPYNLLAIPAWTVAPCGSGPSVHIKISSHIDWILATITPNLSH